MLSLDGRVCMCVCGPRVDWRHMWDQTGDEYKKIHREGGARASEAKKVAKPGCMGG